MKGKLIRLAVSFDESGGVLGCDITHGRVGIVDFGDGPPEETTKAENVSLGRAELSAQTVKLLQTLGDVLVADVVAVAKKKAAVAQQAAAEQLKEAQRRLVEAQDAKDRAAKDVSGG